MTASRLLLRSAGRWVAPLFLLPMAAVSAADDARWEGAWVRNVPPGAAVAAAYGSLLNSGSAPVTVTAVTSTLGAAAQMHDIVASGDQRRMVPVDARTLAPGEALVFTPGGLHIMLMEFAEAPKEGDAIELCAVTIDSETICTLAPVRRDAPAAAHHDAGHHH
ncbi:MAG: copper chaperone PCu(A)C [Halieaceae bacterium]